MSRKHKGRRPTPKLREVPTLNPVRTRYYFAYGSNLSVKTMGERAPLAKKLSGLRLPGYRLVFRGVADIEHTGRTEDWVEGGIWKISVADEAMLDRFEGARGSDPARGFYRKLNFNINMQDGTSHEVLIYKMNHDGVMPPSQIYYDTIKEGYDDFHLDVSKLEAALRESWEHREKTELLLHRYVRKGRPKLARHPDFPVQEEEPEQADDVEQEEAPTSTSTSITTVNGRQVPVRISNQYSPDMFRNYRRDAFGRKIFRGEPTYSRINPETHQPEGLILPDDELVEREERERLRREHEAKFRRPNSNRPITVTPSPKSKLKADLFQDVHDEIAGKTLAAKSENSQGQKEQANSGDVPGGISTKSAVDNKPVGHNSNGELNGELKTKENQEDNGDSPKKP